ncbi:hypothetical protein AAMO2058_000579900 [Amorphochlora amoebiformis]
MTTLTRLYPVISLGVSCVILAFSVTKSWRPTLQSTLKPLAPTERVNFSPKISGNIPNSMRRASRLRGTILARADQQKSSLDSLSSLLGGLEPTEAPPSEVNVPAPKAEVSSEVFNGLEGVLRKPEVDSVALAQELNVLKEKGVLKRWGAVADETRSRPINFAQLKNAGIQNPESLAGGDVQDDLTLLVSYVLVSSVLATGAANFPGQAGFFLPYLIAGSSLVLLGIGSTNPGILSGPKTAIAKLNPEFERRLIRHEAAHFLAGYLLGIPVKEYNIDTPTGISPHVEFAEFMDEETLRKPVPRAELEKFGPLAMSGLAAEGLEFETVKGGQADLLQLQIMLDRGNPRMSPTEQQDFTRWAVYRAVEILKSNRRAHDDLMVAMTEGRSVIDCIRAIEGI